MKRYKQRVKGMKGWTEGGVVKDIFFDNKKRQWQGTFSDFSFGEKLGEYDVVKGHNGWRPVVAHVNEYWV